MYRLRRSESIGLDSLTQLFRQTTYISCNTLLPLSRIAAISSLLRLKPYGHRTPATPPVLTLLHHHMWTSPIFFPSSSTLVIIVLSLGVLPPALGRACHEDINLLQFSSPISDFEDMLKFLDFSCKIPWQIILCFFIEEISNPCENLSKNCLDYS